MYRSLFAPPATRPPCGRDELRRPDWLWRGSGSALTAGGLLPLTLEGAVPPVQTPAGPGLRIERGTTNLITNPSFEVDLAGWSTLGAAVATRETVGGGAVGSAYARVAVAGAGDGLRFAASGDAGQGSSYTGSVYLRAATAADTGKSVQLYLDAPGGTYEIVATGHVLTESWERVVLPVTWAEAGHTGWGLTVRDAIGQGGFTFEVDAAQHEPGELSTYADGDRGSGHGWTGTAHASTSTREHGSASCRLACPAAEGTLLVGLAPLWGPGDGRVHPVVDLVATDGSRLALRGAADGSWEVQAGGGTTSLTQTHAASDAVVLALDWSADALVLHAGDADSPVLPRPVAPGARWVHLDFGRDPDTPSEAADAILLGAALFAHRLPPAERTRRLRLIQSAGGWALVR